MSPKYLITILLLTPLFIHTSSHAFFNYTLCKKEPIEFSGEKKYPFNSLHELKSLDDLHKFGLSSPDKTDHEKYEHSINNSKQKIANIITTIVQKYSSFPYTVDSKNI